MHWSKLSMADRALYIALGVKNGITSLDSIRDAYNTFAEGGPYSAGEMTNTLYESAEKVESLGEPSHHYDFTQTEEWANAHGYYPDERGHRDDRVKKPAHPTHPSRGKWNGPNEFQLTDLGMQDPNYIMFGMADGDQDPQATLTYNGAIVLPEITVTPKGNYIHNSYDNLNIILGIPKRSTYNSYAEGGESETTRPKVTKPMSDFDWWWFNTKNRFKGSYNKTKESIQLAADYIDDKVDIISNPKDAAYSIMVGRRGNTFGTTRYNVDIQDALANMDEIVSSRGKIPRNLASLYIYGNDLNQFEEASDLRNVGVEYDNYLKSIGRNPNKVTTYKGNIPYSVTLPEAVKTNLTEYIKSSKNRTYGNEQGPGIMDNVAGFLQRLSLDTSGLPVVVNSDLWDFEPNSYSDKYNDDPKSWIKAKALDMVGTPFILKDVQPVNFIDVGDFYDRYDTLSELEKSVAKDFGFLPGITVTAKKKN